MIYQKPLHETTHMYVCHTYLNSYCRIVPFRPAYLRTTRHLTLLISALATDVPLHQLCTCTKPTQYDSARKRPIRPYLKGHNFNSLHFLLRIFSSKSSPSHAGSYRTIRRHGIDATRPFGLLLIARQTFYGRYHIDTGIGSTISKWTTVQCRTGPHRTEEMTSVRSKARTNLT